MSTVPDLPEAVEFLGGRLGLRATPSPADPEGHSRVFLHRSYREVAVSPQSTEWRTPLGGDEAALAEVLASFLGSYGSLVEDIEAGITAQNSPRVERASHTG